MITVCLLNTLFQNLILINKKGDNMKKYHKKRLAAFKVGLVLSIMITPFCFSMKVFADQYTYGVYTYGYGKASYVVEPFTSSNTSRWNYKATITFGNDKYTSMDVAVTVTGLNNYSAVLTENCEVTYMNVSSSLIIVRMKCQVSAKIEVYTSSLPQVVDAWNYGNPVTTYSDGQFDYVANMNTYVVNGYGVLQTTRDYVGAVNASIITLQSQLGYSTSDTLKDTLDTIKTEILAAGVANTAMLTQLGKLTDIDGKLGQIKANLDALNLIGIDVVDHLEDYFSDVQGIDNIYSNLVSLNNKLDTIITSLSNIQTSINNIDNSIDTISWVDFTTPTEIYYSKTGNDDYVAFNTNVTFTTKNIYLKIPTLAVRYNHLFKLTLPCSYYNSVSNGGYIMDDLTIESNAVNIRVLYYTTTPNSQLVVYFVFDVAVNGSNLYLKISNNSTTGRLTYGGDMSLKYLPVDDIEYWQLSSYFNQYEYNKKILEAINNVTISVSNNTEQNTINNISNYDQSKTAVNNVQNNYINNFNNNNSTIVSELSTKLTVPQGFINASQFIKALFPRVVDNSNIVGLPYYIIIAAVVLFCLLG